MSLNFIWEDCGCVDVKSEDLPIKCVRDNHEELVRYKAYNFCAPSYPFALDSKVRGFFILWANARKSEEKKMSEANNKNTGKKGKGLLILGISILAVLIGLFLILFSVFGPKTTEGSKNVTLSVVGESGDATSYEAKTDALVLQDLMDELKEDGFTYSGNESEYGLMVDTINGVRADYTLDGAYWSFYVNDAYCNYGIAEQPVNDGDAFSIVYTPAQ